MLCNAAHICCGLRILRGSCDPERANTSAPLDRKESGCYAAIISGCRHFDRYVLIPLNHFYTVIDPQHFLHFAADDPVQNEVVPLSEVENHEAETPLISEVPTVEANAEKNDNSENDDDLDDNGESVFVPTTFGKQPHTFFPIHFGRTTGGTIAVANSYNTGKGAALSHSEAHGTKRNH